jgi:hypothetical protein
VPAIKEKADDGQARMGTYLPTWINDKTDRVVNVALIHGKYQERVSKCHKRHVKSHHKKTMVHFARKGRDARCGAHFEHDNEGVNGRFVRRETTATARGAS